jgi:DNA repair exonuclease SbcCD nuclease subunit
MCTQILDLIYKTCPHAVVCLGDILDRHETIHVGPLLRSISFLKSISKDFKLYLIIGNHDRPNNNVFMTEEHPFTALKMWNNTIVVDKTVKDVINGKDFVFVPYVSPGRFKEALSGIDFRDARAIFAHQEFYGAKMGPVPSVQGDRWEKDYPLVISGHIHEFDRLQDNIIYTGTPIQHSYGDREDKGVFLFRFGDDRLGELRVTVEDRFDKFELDIPKKKIINIQVSEIDTIKKLDPKCQYKVIISGTPQELKCIKLGKYPRNVKLSFKTVSTIGKTEAVVDIEKKDFLGLVFEELKTLELISYYQEIFGATSTYKIIE